MMTMKKRRARRVPVRHGRGGRSGGSRARATIGGICTSLNGCFSQAEYNGNFDCATALVAHELGHLWGAFHCDCVDFTMNPFNTCENQFSDGSISSILAHRDSRDCLSPLETAFTVLPLE